MAASRDLLLGRVFLPKLIVVLAKKTYNENKGSRRWAPTKKYRSKLQTNFST